MKVFSILSCLVVVSVASGCSEVTVREPIGELAPITDREAIQGAWVDEDGEMFQIHLSKSGNLVARSLSWDDDNDDFCAETMSIVASTSENANFLHLKKDVEDSGEPGKFFFCRYDLDDLDTMRLYLPLIPTFQEAVVSGVLKGHVKKFLSTVDVQINDSSDEIVNFVHSRAKACFEEKPSVTFKRLKEVK